MEQEYKILIKVKEELEGLKDTVEALKETSNEANILKNTLQGIGFDIGSKISSGLSQIPSLIASSVKEYASQEAAEKNLQTALKATGNEVENNFNYLKKLSDELEILTNADGKAILEMQSVALAMGVSSEQMDAVTKGAIGLSKAMNMDLQTATKASAAAIQGKTELLTRYIPTLSECKTEQEKYAKVLHAQNAGFEIAKAELGTLQGQFTALGHSLGAVSEVFGEAFAPSAKLSVQTLNKLARLIEEYKDYVIPAITITTSFATLLGGKMVMSLSNAFIEQQKLNKAIFTTSKAYQALGAEEKANYFTKIGKRINYATKAAKGFSFALKGASVALVALGAFDFGKELGKKLNEKLIGDKFKSINDSVKNNSKTLEHFAEKVSNLALNTDSLEDLEENFANIKYQIEANRVELQRLKNAKENIKSVKEQELYNAKIEETKARIEKLKNVGEQRILIEEKITSELEKQKQELNQRIASDQNLLKEYAKKEAFEKLSSSEKIKYLTEQIFLENDLIEEKQSSIALGNQEVDCGAKIIAHKENIKNYEKEILNLKSQQLQKQQEQASFDLEWELMEAQAKGNKSQIKAINEKISLNEVMNNLRQKGIFTEDEIAQKAKEYISLQKQIENNEKQKAFDEFQSELKIQKLRAEGKNDIADLVELQDEAKQKAKEWAVPYSTALEKLKELKKLEKQENKKGDKKEGKNVNYSEEEKAKAKKILARGEGGTVGKKTLEQAKAITEGKEIEGKKVSMFDGFGEPKPKSTYEIMVEKGKIPQPSGVKSIAAKTSDENIQTPQVPTNLAQQTPQIPISQTQQSSATPAQNQNSQANHNTDQKSPNSNSQDSKLLQSMVNYLKELVSTQKQIKKKLADLENTVGKIATN